MRQDAIPRERWHAAFVDSDQALPDAYFVACDGDRYVGVSVVHRTADEPAVLIAGFTGVLLSHAGRGIGLGLKLETIAYARSHGYREIRTGVLAENLPMLRINKILGFQLHQEELKQYVY
jgi:RimJ/RimL family protein N-acetyltransferase